MTIARRVTLKGAKCGLKQLDEFVLQEWVTTGKCAEDFCYKGPKIIIILDNASHHKRKDIIDKIQK